MRALWSRAARSRLGPWWPILVLLLVNLSVGLWLAPHYGQSTDEEPNILFARASLESYQHPEDPHRDPSREDKGPFYLMLWLRAGELLGRVVPGWIFADGRHFVNFLTFQMALVSMYALAIRLVRPSVALAGVLLFATQPVVFGHAFINQKDTPFMAFFAAALALGIGLVDQFSRGWERSVSVRERPDRAGPSSWAILRQVWAEERPRARRAVALAVGLLLLVPIGRMLLNGPLRAAIEGTIGAAYRGQSWPLINQLFSRLAEHAATVTPEAYILRAVRLMDLATAAASLLMVLVGIAAATWVWPVTRRRFWPAVGREVKEGMVAPVPGLLIPAAIVLGMGIAVRSLTLFAGALVVLYAMIRAGPRMAILLAVYFGAAWFIAYLLWPQLWGSPAGVISASLYRTVQFPQPHRTLFEGVVLQSNDMPGWYLPGTMAIQLTLPAQALILFGLALGVMAAFGRGAPTGLYWVLLLWALVPFVAVVVFRVPIYNYFRHVLFMMPALFILGAVALERVLRPVRSRSLAAVIVMAVLAPGLVAIARLHPYEYGYFNEWVGGVRGAYGRFMSDYWCTSLREGMEYINGVAPPSSGVALSGPMSNAKAFARQDLHLGDVSEMASDPDFEPTVILACNWATIDPDFFPDAPLIWSVEREGVPLAIVKLLVTPEPEASPASP